MMPVMVPLGMRFKLCVAVRPPFALLVYHNSANAHHANGMGLQDGKICISQSDYECFCSHGLLVWEKGEKVSESRRRLLPGAPGLHRVTLHDLNLVQG